MISIIERDGRYFVQCEDGEIERTPEQMRVLAERLKANADVLKERLTAWEDKFKNSRLATGTVPKNSWAYLDIDDHMQAMKQLCQLDFNEGNSLESCSKMCEMAISQLKMARAAPYADKDLIKYYLAGWKDIRRFISLFPAQPAASAGPLAPLLLSYTVGELTALLTSLGLIGPTGQATPVASSGAWVGVFYALLEANPRRIVDNKARASRAFHEAFNAKVSERALQNGLGKRGSEAERIRDSAGALLKG